MKTSKELTDRLILRYESPSRCEAVVLELGEAVCRPAGFQLDRGDHAQIFGTVLSSVVQHLPPPLQKLGDEPEEEPWVTNLKKQVEEHGRYNVVVYTAGPYRAPTEYGVYYNIRQAEAYALRVWQLGAACICPHKNTEMFGGVAPDDVWLTGDLTILHRMLPGRDVVLMLPGWERSSGSQGELKLARKLGLFVFYVGPRPTP